MRDTGLMAFWSDIAPQNILAYQQWHNCEHMPERVSTAGFRRGCRYRARDGRGQFLMFYETRDPDVFASDAYLGALNAPTQWTREALTWFENPVRNIYRLIHGEGMPGQFAAPWLTSLRFNCDDASALRSWAEAMGRDPEALRVRLYEVDERISQIMTSERKIYSGGPGAQRYLAMIEARAAFAGGRIASDADASLEPASPSRRDIFADDYWLEITHVDPNEAPDD